jgi:hypothetical protein
MRALLFVATLWAIATLSGCAGSQPQPPVAESTHEAAPTAVVPPAPPAATPSPGEPNQSNGRAAAPPAPRQETASTPPPSQPPAARAPPKAPSSPAEPKSPAQPPVAAAAPPEPKTAAPTLDLDGLELRLRDTHAIGMFTKLSLKNQVNDLLAEFREFHDGKANVPLANLRQEYEQLLLKVVTLLQDADEPLAKAVASSREAIWGILADPKSFSKI